MTPMAGRVAGRVAETRPLQTSIAPPVSAGPLPGYSHEIGSDGVAAQGGALVGGERNRELIGRNLYETYGTLLADCRPAAAPVRYALALIEDIEWESTPNRACPDIALAKRVAETVRLGLLEADSDQPWPKSVAKQALHKYFGFSIHAWKFRKYGSITGIELGHRPQFTITRWDIPEDGKPWCGVEQQTPAGGKYYLPRTRLWYTADQTLTDQPTGVGLLRHVVEAARELERVSQIALYGLDANLRGVPIGKAPLAQLYNYAKVTLKYSDEKARGYVASQTGVMMDFLQNHIKTAEQGLLLDSAVFTIGAGNSTSFSGVSQWGIDLLTGDSAGIEEAIAKEAALELGIARMFSAEFMYQGDGGGGSYAQHVDKTSQFGAQVNSIAQVCGRTARMDLARPIVIANYGLEIANIATPMLTAAPVSTGDIIEQIGGLATMKAAGAYMPPDDPVWNIARKRMRFPPAPRMAPEVGGSLRTVPRDPNDPANPANGGDGIPRPTSGRPSTAPTPPVRQVGGPGPNPVMPGGVAGTPPIG